MIKHDKKDKTAILVGGLVILMAVLIAIWVADKAYGSKLIVYAAIALGIGFIGSKVLFVLEKKKTRLYEKRCEINATTVIKHVITFFSSFITCIVIYHLRYIDYTAIIIVGIVAGIIVALAEFFTSKKGLDDCDLKTYDDDWWKENQANDIK